MLACVSSAEILEGVSDAALVSKMRGGNDDVSFPVQALKMSMQPFVTFAAQIEAAAGTEASAL